MSEVSRNANAYTIQEENSTTYCTPRSHPGETPTAGPRCGRRDRLLVQSSAHRHAMERSTSKTCSACHGCCGPFEALETRRREELKAKATTDHEKKKAAYHKIRGLRRCQNAECGVILHRDRNAASNIAENFYRLYEGKPCLGKLTAQETALHEALGKLEY